MGETVFIILAAILVIGLKVGLPLYLLYLIERDINGPR
jgi:hypothetical protein